MRLLLCEKFILPVYLAPTTTVAVPWVVEAPVLECPVVSHKNKGLLPLLYYGSTLRSIWCVGGV